MTEPPVTLFDVNALVAVALTTHQHHHAAHRHLRALDGTWATASLTEAGLFRLLLNPLVTGSQRLAADVGAVLQGMRGDPRWTFLEDATSLADPIVDTTVLMGHRQVTDLHLVNLAARHGGVLATFDAGIRSWLAPEDRQHIVVIPA
ncbi:TA system VapC family ribonuclease toxin [Ornithinimicrobium cryptoxanthini]|uniref:TA system VapC family ribonuclease toxin n=1 Tax=Ornithinimicrobium cryptoxanthini TaxID=2934161 RepID=UPI002117DFCB|nr:TA system VapC family ribonuclease toxin [Ornithinimicrobium cryptoxanthini]